MNAGSPPDIGDPAPVTPSTQPRRCAGKKANGKRCHAPPLKDSNFCINHDPRRRVKERQREASAAGGKARMAMTVMQWERIEIKDGESLMRFINEVLNLTAGGKMPAKTSYALVPHLANMVRLLEAQGCGGDRAPAIDPAELLTPVLGVLDANPSAKAELIKQLEMLGK